MLEITDLSAGYFPGREVIHNIHVRVAPGSLVSVIGSNGAGKSTLLGGIFGFVPHARGQVRLAGQQLVGLPPHEIARAGVRMVPENRGTLVSLSVQENLQLGGLGLSKHEIAERMERQLQRFPRLKERLHQRAGMLSGGEQQMLVIGRSLMARPGLILLDEPSLGLAPLLVQEIYEIIKNINVKEKTSILLVEQNARAALGIADYAYVIESGRIAMSGSAEELKNNEDIQEFYMGLSSAGSKKNYREIKHYRRKKRWIV